MKPISPISIEGWNPLEHEYSGNFRPNDTIGYSVFSTISWRSIPSKVLRPRRSPGLTTEYNLLGTSVGRCFAYPRPVINLLKL